MSNIIYTYNNDLYINLTNKCPCACIFCIRSQRDGVGSADSLWLENEPTAEQVIDEIKKLDLSRYDEVVFCGFGEPLCALDNLLEILRYLRRENAPHIRINTNGLGDLVNQKQTAPLLEGLVDTISISLNAPDAEKYYEIVRPKFGVESFGAMLAFTADCKKYIKSVKLSIVDTIPLEDIEKCREIAQKIGVYLRVRNADVM